MVMSKRSDIEVGARTTILWSAALSRTTPRSLSGTSLAGMSASLSRRAQLLSRSFARFEAWVDLCAAQSASDASCCVSGIEPAKATTEQRKASATGSAAMPTK